MRGHATGDPNNQEIDGAVLLSYGEQVGMPTRMAAHRSRPPRIATQERCRGFFDPRPGWSSALPVGAGQPVRARLISTGSVRGCINVSVIRCRLSAHVVAKRSKLGRCRIGAAIAVAVAAHKSFSRRKLTISLDENVLFVMSSDYD